MPKPRTCSSCGTVLVECDPRGIPVQGGGFLVCPDALKENTADQFGQPYQRRRHRKAGVVESYKHAKARRAAAKAAQLALLPESAGRRMSA